MGNDPRLFRLIRDTDVSGVSGTGHVADGVIFSDGEGAVHFLGRRPTTTPHPGGIESIEEIHGHEGSTRIEFLDEEPNRMTKDELRQAFAEILAGHAGSKAFLSEDSAYGHIREVWFGYADALIANLPSYIPARDATVTRHLMTSRAVTDCCGMSLYELPPTDRVTNDASIVTCAQNGIRKLAWPIDRLNPANGKPWPRCPVHPEYAVIGTCAKCEKEVES